MSKIPFLSVDERAQYLLDKGYTKEPEVSDFVRDYLRHNNFHHFLGYARNYGQLVTSGRAPGAVSLDHLVQIIESDKAVSVILFQALQVLEHQLRAQLVESHCSLFEATNCFLDSTHFIKMSLSRDTPEVAIISQILRMREPYVADRIRSYMDQNSISGQPENLNSPHRRSAVAGFPIWSFVDGLSFGVLADIIITTKPNEEGQTIRDAVARACSVPRTHLDTQLKSLIVLRNQVAHHSRLWMRPTTNSPKLPNAFKKHRGKVDPKSMYVVWLTLASFFRENSAATKLISDLDQILENDPIYALGVKNPLR